MVHNGSAISNAVTTFEGNKVTIKMNKTNEDGSTNWSSSWAMGENKYIQVQFTFSELVEDFSISNIIFNNKLITLNTESATESTVTTIDSSNSMSNDTIQDNIIENQNAVQENAVEQNQTTDSSGENITT